MRKITKNHVGYSVFAVVSIALILFLAALSVANLNKAEAMSPPGLNAAVATSSTIQVNPNSNTNIFGTSTNEVGYQCAARMITTSGTPVTISFSYAASSSLSTTAGYLQGSSTGATYDGGLYGCGYWMVRATNGTSTITLTETH